MVDPGNVGHMHHPGARRARKPPGYAGLEEVETLIAAREEHRYRRPGSHEIVQPTRGPGSLPEHVKRAPDAVASAEGLTPARVRALEDRLGVAREHRVTGLPVEWD